MKAGAAEERVYLNLPIKKLDHELDPLYVKVLQTEQVVFVSFDATSMPGKAVSYFKHVVSRETGMPEENIIISMTHSFSSPHFNGEENYKAFEEALIKAIQKIELKEAGIGFGRSECAINVQRNVKTEQGWWIGRDLKGFSNRDVKSIFFFHDEKPFACLVNADVQSSCVMEKDPTAVSADLPGALADAYRKEGIACFFLAGACADQAPLNDDHLTLAAELKNSILIPEIEPWEEEELHTSFVSLEMQEMTIPTKELTPHTSFNFVPAREIARVPIIFLRWNNITLCMTSPELNSGYGVMIEELLPERSMIVTMTNGAFKYLPQEWDFENITYEAMNTVLARGSDERFFAALEKELHQ